MTNRIDRLSARGLVERYPDPDDRRGVIVRLTGEGKDAVDAAFTALLEAERTLLEDLPERDRTRLASLLRQLLAPFHALETEPVRAPRRAGDRAD
jgi:DNA-binding MarR family transcriptional regulator